MAKLPGWNAEDHVAAVAVVRQTCVITFPSKRSHFCLDVLGSGALGEDAARTFLETHLRAEPIEGGGLLTAYYSPWYEARTAPEGEFTAAARPAPPNPGSAPERAVIERAPAPDALAWMRPEDLFFLQVQGSGVITFADGTSRRATFAATNGRPFVPIAKRMAAQGLIARADASALHVHDWLAGHRGPVAQAVMDEDPRYVFFHLARDDGGQPLGASGARQRAGRSLAIDPAYHPYFELLWIDARGGTLGGARPAYQRLAVAMDRGGAITGPVRADLFMGSGTVAGEEAARVGHTLRLYRITPIQP